MTGPVERVPLTDEQLDDWARQCSGPPAAPEWRASLAPRLIAELRAARAELSVLRPALRRAKGRIDKALRFCDDFDGATRLAEYVWAALAGPTEATETEPAVTHLAVIQASLPPGLTEVAGGSQEHCQSALEEWVRASGLRDGERALIVGIEAETVAEPGVGVYTVPAGRP